MELSRSSEIHSAEVTTKDGTCAARAVFSKGYRNKTVKMNFNWTQKTRYGIRLTTDAGKIDYTVVSPEAAPDEFFVLHFPFGMKSRNIIIPGQTEITGSLQLKNDLPTPRELEVYLSFSQGFGITDPDDGRYRKTAFGTVVFRDWVILKNAYDSKIIGIKVSSPDQRVSESGGISLKICENQHTVFEQTVRIRVLGPDVLSRHIRVTAMDFPTNDKGERDQRLMGDVLQLTPIGRFLALVTGKVEDDVDHGMVPYTFYTLTLKNTMREDVAVIVRAWVEDRTGGESLAAFRPHFHVTAAGELFSSVVAPGGRSQEIVMPLYVEPASVLPGTYHLCYSLTQFGTSAPFAHGTYDFQVAKQPLGPMAVTAAGGLPAIFFMSGLILFFKRIYGGFKVRWIILAALYGAVGFVGVNIPGLFLADLFHALLGPFSFLATGLFFGVIQYMLWGSLMVLVPQKGMMTLVMTVRMLLGGVMLGNISAVSMISLFVHAFLVELFLWLTGCTRGKKAVPPEPVALISAFIISDVISTFFNFESAIFLYRLYYANWFIFLNCLIGGVLYTLVGTLLGLNMGKKLGMVVE